MDVTVELTPDEVATRLEEMANAGAYHKLTPDARALLYAVARVIRNYEGRFVKQ
jgi:predicted nucleic acid-binding OB-fold protein